MFFPCFLAVLGSYRLMPLGRLGRLRHWREEDGDMPCQEGYVFTACVGSSKLFAWPPSLLEQLRKLLCKKQLTHFCLKRGVLLLDPAPSTRWLGQVVRLLGFID